MNVAMDMGTAASRSGNETVVGDGDMDMDAMLEMRQVTKRYENFTLDHVDFVVPKGYVTGLIGENGAGKTTLMKAALGLIRTEEGENPAGWKAAGGERPGGERAVWRGV